MKPSLLVLAAGIGSRYGGLKQIDPVGPSGEIIIDYSIYDAIKAGFGKVVFVIRKDIEKDFREIIGARFESKIETEYVFQELQSLPEGFKVPEGRAKPWGTAHAILVARKAVDEPFAVINADDFYGRHGYQLLSAHLSRHQHGVIPDYCMVGFRLANTLSEHGHVARGVCRVSSDSSLVEVVERTKIEKCPEGARFTSEDGTTVSLSGDETVSMNMWGFTPAIFPELEAQFKDFLQVKQQDLKAEFFIPSVVSKLIENRQANVKVLHSDDLWFGVTYRQDKPVVIENLRKLVGKGVYPQNIL